MNTHKPFARQGNFTQTDNLIYDVIMPAVSGNAFKILSLILRHTKGYHCDSYEVNYAGLQEGTGIKSEATVNRALDELISGIDADGEPRESLCKQLFGHDALISQRGAKSTSPTIYALNPDFEISEQSALQKLKCTLEIESKCTLETKARTVLNKDVKENTHTARENEPQTQTFAAPAKPDALTHSKPQAVTPLDLLRGAVLETIGAKMRYEMGSFSHADRMRLDNFVRYLETASRTPHDLTLYLERLPKFFNKPQANRPSLQQLIDTFDRVLEMDLTPAPAKQSRWAAPSGGMAPDYDTTQSTLNAYEQRKARIQAERMAAQ